MREHIGLFRGKRTDNGEWIFGNLVQGNRMGTGERMFEIWGIMPEGENDPNKVQYGEVDPDTVGECTGLIDKNGTLIFEGDIVLKRTYNGKKPFPVTYNAGMFHCGYGGGSSTPTHGYTLDDKQIEIIGNRYDNPELIT